MSETTLRHPAANPSIWLSGEPVTIAVAGTSMAPFLLEGDRLVVVRAAREALLPGQVVVFERSGEVVAHRLLAAGRDRFLEKGDAQAMGNWWPWPEHLGVAVARLRGQEREDFTAPGSLKEMARQARAHLRAHRITVFAGRVPWSPARRAVSKLLAPFRPR